MCKYDVEYKVAVWQRHEGLGKFSLPYFGLYPMLWVALGT